MCVQSHSKTLLARGSPGPWAVPFVPLPTPCAPALLASLEVLLETFLEPQTGTRSKGGRTGTPLPGPLDLSFFFFCAGSKSARASEVTRGQLGSQGEGRLPRLPPEAGDLALAAPLRPSPAPGRPGAPPSAAEQQRHLLGMQLLSRPCRLGRLPAVFVCNFQISFSRQSPL